MTQFDISTQKYFNEFTPAFNPQRFGFALEYLDSIEPGASIIDIGCGDGATMALVRDNTRQKNLVGLDIADSYLAQVRERLGCQTILGSILDDQFIASEAGKFDVAILGAVLHHLVGSTRTESLGNARKALRNALRLLRPGGVLLVFEPTHQPRAMMFLVFWIKRLVSAFVSRRVEIGGRNLNFGQPVVSYLTDEDLRAELTGAGFELDRFNIDDQSRIGGLILRRGIGVIARRPAQNATG